MVGCGSGAGGAASSPVAWRDLRPSEEMPRRQSLTAHAAHVVRGLTASECIRLASRLALESRPESRELAAVVLRHVDPTDSAAWSRAGHLAWQLVHDSAVDVRREAAISFACLAEDAGTALSELRHDDRPGVRLAITFALGEARGEAEVEALLALLRDENVEVRRWAALMLAALESTSADALGSKMERGLCGALTDEDREVRGEAMVGLAKLGCRDDRFVGALRASLHADAYDDWSLEAAEIVASASVLESLIALRDALRASGLAEEARSVEDVLSRLVAPSCEGR